jgi:hypothetical protein
MRTKSGTSRQNWPFHATKVGSGHSGPPDGVGWVSQPDDQSPGRAVPRHEEGARGPPAVSTAGPFAPMPGGSMSSSNGSQAHPTRLRLAPRPPVPRSQRAPNAAHPPPQRQSQTFRRRPQLGTVACRWPRPVLGPKDPERQVRPDALGKLLTELLADETAVFQSDQVAIYQEHSFQVEGRSTRGRGPPDPIPLSGAAIPLHPIFFIRFFEFRAVWREMLVIVWRC